MRKKSALRSGICVGLALAALLVGCGGKSTPAEKAAAQAAAPRKVLFYRNPMNPAVISPVPAKDEMGMEYVPVYEEDLAAKEAPGMVPGTVPGLASVEMGSTALRLAGVQTAVAERRTMTRSARAVGLVTVDERRVRHVHTKVSGWVEKLYVNTTGQAVRAGQPLLAIFSPELLASQEEYLRARTTAERFAGSQLPEVRRGGEDLLTAARHRLELFDVPQSVLAQLDRTGRPQRTVTLVSPVSGYVSSKDVVEGMEIQPGANLLTVSDLSRVWVEADLYEVESRNLRLGQKATVVLPYDSGERRTGTISWIDPFLNPESRTIKVRIELANPGLALKPGMYVDVVPELGASEGVVIPDSAVIDTGARQVVFVKVGPVGNEGFEPREVRLGSRGDGFVLVLDGVQAGESVAVRANFLLDSESRLRAAVAGLAKEHKGGAQ